MTFISVLFSSSLRTVAALSAAVFLGLSGLTATAASDPTDDTIVAINWKSLDINQTIAEVWVTYSFPRTIALGHGLYPHRSQRLQYAIACDERTLAVSQWLLTDEDGGSGQVVWSGREDVLRFSAPWAGSAEADLVAQACEHQPERDTAAVMR